MKILVVEARSVAKRTRSGLQERYSCYRSRKYSQNLLISVPRTGKDLKWNVWTASIINWKRKLQVLENVGFNAHLEQRRRWRKEKSYIQMLRNTSTHYGARRRSTPHPFDSSERQTLLDLSNGQRRVQAFRTCPRAIQYRMTSIKTHGIVERVLSLLRLLIARIGYPAI
jgi:hypothetical protein